MTVPSGNFLVIFDVENDVDVHKWWLGWLENQNVENVIVFKAFVEVRVTPTNRLTERVGGSSTSKMALMCISGGLDGLKTKNVEKSTCF